MALLWNYYQGTLRLRACQMDVQNPEDAWFVKVLPFFLTMYVVSKVLPWTRD